MKITLTEKEMLSLLTKAVGMKVTEYHICEPLAIRCRKAVEVWRYLADQKIIAIKELRNVFCGRKNDFGIEFCELSLGRAKWAVENWGKWIAYVEEHDCLPHDGFYETVTVK